MAIVKVNRGSIEDYDDKGHDDKINDAKIIIGDNYKCCSHGNHINNIDKNQVHFYCSFSSCRNYEFIAEYRATGKISDFSVLHPENLSTESKKIKIVKEFKRMQVDASFLFIDKNTHKDLTKHISTFDPVFYDILNGILPIHIGQKTIVMIYIFNRFAGAYYPEIQSLSLSDWVHNLSSVNFAKKIFPILFEELKQYGFNYEYTVKPPVHKIPKITIGCDPEFELIYKERIVRADSHFNGKSIGSDPTGGIELRPNYSDSPEGITENIKKLLIDVYKRGYDISVAGHTFAIGGHIHIGVGKRIGYTQLIDVFDDFIGKSVLKLSGNARKSYKKLSAYESKDYGFEYRTPPSIIFCTEDLTRIVFKLAKNLSTMFFSQDIEYNSPPKENDYIKIGGLTKSEYKYFKNAIKVLSKAIKNKEEIPLCWDIPMPRQYDTKVILRDDWGDKQARSITRIIRRLCKKKITITLYGLKENRGFVATIPVEGMGIVDPIGSLSIGLPFAFRMANNVYDNYKKVVISAILKEVNRIVTVNEGVKETRNVPF